jgi:hypothetical protein
MFKVKNRYTNEIRDVYAVETDLRGNTCFLTYIGSEWYWFLADEFFPV